MGSGKSSTGRQLSKMTDYEFVDIDDEILKTSGQPSIPQIFKEEGNDKFREYEKLALKNILKNKNQIIATGGGSLIYNPPSSLVSEGCLSKDDLIIYLHATFETCSKRCSYSDRRPLFKDPEAAKKLYQERLPLYESMATHKIVIDNINTNKVAKLILEILHNK